MGCQSHELAGLSRLISRLHEIHDAAEHQGCNTQQNQRILLTSVTGCPGLLQIAWTKCYKFIRGKGKILFRTLFGIFPKMWKLYSHKCSLHKCTTPANLKQIRYSVPHFFVCHFLLIGISILAPSTWSVERREEERNSFLKPRNLAILARTFEKPYRLQWNCGAFIAMIRFLQINPRTVAQVCKYYSCSVLCQWYFL